MMEGSLLLVLSWASLVFALICAVTMFGMVLHHAGKTTGHVLDEGEMDDDDDDDAKESEIDSFAAGIGEAARALSVERPNWVKFTVHRLSDPLVRAEVEVDPKGVKVWAKIDDKGNLARIDWDEAERLAELHRNRKRQDEVTANACLAVAVRDHVLSVPRLTIGGKKKDDPA